MDESLIYSLILSIVSALFIRVLVDVIRKKEDVTRHEYGILNVLFTVLLITLSFFINSL